MSVSFGSQDVVHCTFFFLTVRLHRRFNSSSPQVCNVSKVCVSLYPVKDLYREDIALHSAKNCLSRSFGFGVRGSKYPSVERYMRWNVSWLASADSLARTWPSLSLKLYPSQCGIRYHCFISLRNVRVVLKIYFAILHNTVARNNIQHSKTIRLNKQKG